ncbi:MAG: bifunctional precorrin-2 dehydrogenase/sirohydrochlorin ferrochelatase [Chloroflexi bacterium]|nr:bifunctional precorrin-2 dehydrogenase/sirohydrochlorin ferrochelatase [Chloroflexota bacterium]
MNGYPILLNVQGWRCVIVGGGAVASRKAGDLVACGAEVIVISPGITPALAEQVRAGNVTWHQMAYTPGQIAALRPRLVFTATDDTSVNRAAIWEAHQSGALVNAANNEESADFSSMVTLRRPPITVALTTGGASPALAARLKDELARAIGDEYATLAQWLGEVRPTVQDHLPDQAARRDLYQTILDSEVSDHLRRGEMQAARAVFEALVYEAEPPR